jgi:uncharacterized SAM-binding protein YcdF (DUF218 family)
VSSVSDRTATRRVGAEPETSRLVVRRRGGWWAGRSRTWWVVRALAAFVAVSVLYFGATFVQVWRAARSDHAHPADAIVVLGAAQYDGVPSPVLASRLDHALELYVAGIAPVIVVTGGRADGDRFTEATAGATYLHDRGVPDESILRETTGRSTWESIAATARFLDARGLDDVVLVTDPFHAARVDEVAEEVGLNASTSPVADSPIRGAAEWRRMVAETAYIGIGRIIGYRRLEGILG